ncbi:hypothetical protein BOX15_Mlig011075g2 [Macrostomum lignano]|uniref:Uncharacterized protein n=1 Tax=Macrostomum lignano TaxID=282301 RepID=A0A267EJ70_9PLAT|nr:hypothetical protein BOX15_Mlig027303g2 [Macrostomum lignano]PAA73315.1 hypothetical protein BOX15_Mlig011075g1 [Macrostomum lignano]PAA79815.1 hypothetical protein BOX15_Mlig011075g2 [Macrostomum lignano]
MSQLEALPTERRQHQPRVLPPAPLNDWDRYKPTDRSAWWRDQLNRYPAVGQYEPREVSSIQRVNYPSSTFKSSGRQRNLEAATGLGGGGGSGVPPGAYSHRSFTDEMSKDIRSYGFRNSKKSSLDALTEGLVDRQLSNLTPGQYNVETYHSIRVDPEPARGSCFKSRSRRVIKEFEPREGPPPGAYDSSRSTLSQQGVRSSFRSSCPRFVSSYNKVPAPGSYDKSYQTPMSAGMMRMGRQHGLFFSTAFYP